MSSNSKAGMGNREVPFLRLADSLPELQGEIERRVLDVIRSGWYLNGPENKALEQELCERHNAGHCIAVSNGLDALRLIIRGYMDLGKLLPGDEIIVPANTYIATVLAVSEFGLVPVGVEPTANDYNLDFSKIEGHLTPKTKGIMVVHLYGNPTWDSKVAGELHRKGILLIEDNAQAIGAEAAAEGLNGSRITGSLGDAAALSFYPTKNIGAMGDAGAVLTNDGALAARIRALANYGSDRRYHNITCGYNCRMDEIQAAVLRVKMHCLDVVCEKRREMARLYDSLIQNPVVRKPEIFNDRKQVWHQYPVFSDFRDELKDWLSGHGIGTDIHYAVPPHLQPCYEGVFPEGRFPITERLAATELSLPIANVTADDVAYVAEAINSFIPSAGNPGFGSQ